MYNKKLLSKAICISAVCVLLASNLSYAENESTSSKEAKVTTNVEISDEYSAEEFFKLLDPKVLYAGEKDPIAAKERIDKLKTILDKNPENRTMLIEYYENNAYYNRTYENRFATIDNLKFVEKNLKNSDNIELQLQIYDQIARSYTEVWDYDNAEKTYKKASAVMQKNKDLLKPYQIIDNYVSRIYFYLGKGDIKEAFALYKAGKNFLDNLDQKDLELELKMNEPVIQYYVKTYDTKNIKEALDYHMSLANDTGNENIKEFTLREYLNYYKMNLDIDGTKKAIKKLRKKTKSIHNENSIENIYSDIENADVYYYISQEYEEAKKYALEPDKYTDEIEKNRKKAEEYAQKAVNTAEQFKDISPTVYAYSLQKLATAYAKQNKLEESEKTMAEAIAQHKKASRELSYFLFEGYFAEANAHRYLKQYDKAIEKYKKLEKKLDRKFKTPSLEHTAIYYNMAEAYSEINKEAEAIKYIDKQIEITTAILGANSIRTLGAHRVKSELYKNLGKTDLAVKEAKELLYKIKEYGIVDTYDLEFRSYMLIAKDAFDKDKLDDAFANATKALETSYSKTSKEEANNLIAEIYKKQGKTLKALKYKIK